jgi:hypothetical protein
MKPRLRRPMGGKVAADHQCRNEQLAFADEVHLSTRFLISSHAGPSSSLSTPDV